MSQSQLSDPRARLLTLMGISEEEGTPSYYRLLGLDPFEENAEVIKAQVERRTRMLTMHKTGPYIEASRELLYAVNSAKTCLLNPRLKDIYDRKLRNELGKNGAPAATRPGRPAPASDTMSGGKTGVLKRPTGDKPTESKPTEPKRTEPPTAESSMDDDLLAIESLLAGGAAGGGPQARGGDERDDLDLVLDGDGHFPGNLDEPVTGGDVQPADEPREAERPAPQAAARPAASPQAGAKPATGEPTNGAQAAARKSPASKPAATAAAKSKNKTKPAQPPTAKTAAKGRPAPSGGKAAPPSSNGSQPAQAAVPWIPEDAGYEIVSPAASKAMVDGQLPGDVEDDDDELAEDDGPPGGEEPSDEAAEDRPRVSRKQLGLLAAVGGLVVVAGFLYLSGLIAPSKPQFDSPPRTGVSTVPRPERPAAAPPKAALGTRPSEAAAVPVAAGPVVEIGVAYSTEKRYWLEEAANRFAASPEGRRIRVNLIPMESPEAVRAIVRGDERIHAWAPANRAYREMLLRQWQERHGEDPGVALNPIVREEVLAISPMVIVMWKSRYDAFMTRSPDVSLKTFGYAMHADSGWDGIAGRPEWGRFKFRHTDPERSNSGLMTLVALAYEFYGKTSGLTVEDVTAPQFQQYMSWFGGWVAGVSDSTGDLMKDMILKGPSVHDAVMVYESAAIGYFEMADGRWEPLVAVYPERNLWNDNPYYVLGTPWRKEPQQKAASTFLDFLLSAPIQAKALEHGFRPGNPSVPVKGPDSPFTRYARYGLRVELPEACELPRIDVLENLQQGWQRNAAPH